MTPCDLFLLAVKSSIRHGLNHELTWLCEPTPLLLLMDMASSAFNLDYLIDILINMHNVSFLFEKRPGRLLGYDMAKIVQDPHML